MLAQSVHSDFRSVLYVHRSLHFLAEPRSGNGIDRFQSILSHRSEQFGSVYAFRVFGMFGRQYHLPELHGEGRPPETPAATIMTDLL